MITLGKSRPAYFAKALLLAGGALLAGCSTTSKGGGTAMAVEPASIDFGKVEVNNSPGKPVVRSFGVVAPGGGTVTYGGVDMDGLPLSLAITPAKGGAADGAGWEFRTTPLEAAASPDHGQLRFMPHVIYTEKNWPADGKELAGTIRFKVRPTGAEKFTTVKLPVKMFVVKGS